MEGLIVSYDFTVGVISINNCPPKRLLMWCGPPWIVTTKLTLFVIPFKTQKNVTKHTRIVNFV